MVRKMIFIIFFIVIISIPVMSTPLDSYVILEGEHGSLVGQNLSIQESDASKYVSVSQGYQNDLISLMLDISQERTYEFWFYVKGSATGMINLYSSDGKRVLQGDVSEVSGSWHWIKLKKVKKLKPGRYYLTLSQFTGPMQIDQVIVKTNLKSAKEKATETPIQTNSVPSLPNESPWLKQGLNPFTALLQNGNEFVSTTSGILTISATDLNVPGRGGLDLTISRYYNSKSHFEDGKNSTYFYGQWEFGFPEVGIGKVSFPNGSECNLNDDEVKLKVVELANKDKEYIYTNSINRYFKLVRHEKYTGDLLFLFPQYDIEYYKLYLSDGSMYYFNASGKILYIQGRNANNKIEFYYNANGTLYQIKDTLGHYYTINRSAAKIDIVRAEDNKVMVSYGLENSNVKTVTDVLGRITTYTYSEPGITKISYPSGKVSKYTYQTDSHYYTWYDEDGDPHKSLAYSLYWVTAQEVYNVHTGLEVLVKKSNYEYNFSDQENRKIRYIKENAYNENGTLVSGTYFFADSYGMLIRTKTIDEIAGKAARTTYLEYSINKEKIKESVYYGNIYENIYDDGISQIAVTTNKLSKESRWLIKEENWIYDKWGNLVYYKDPEGYETMICYVNSDWEKVFYRVGAGNGGANAFYDNSTLANTSMNSLPSGELKIRRYLDEYRQTFEAAETYYQYDNAGNLVEVKTLSVDEYGVQTWVKTQYQNYDIYGNCRKQIIDALSASPIVLTFDYDTEHAAYLTGKTQPISRNLVEDTGILIIPGKNVKTSYVYDFKTGKQLKIIDPRNREVVYEYDDFGRAKKVIFPKTTAETSAAYEEAIYDDANKKVTIYDGERKNLVVHSFDGLGRAIKRETYASINNTVLNSASGLTGTVLDSTVETACDWQNQVKTSKDQNGRVATFEYDLFGRQTKATTADGNVTTIAYNDLERKVTTTDPNGKIHTVIFDRKGQKVRESYENKGNILTYYYEYDGYGNLVKTTDAKNQQMGYIYNNLGQLIQVRYPDHLGQVYDFPIPNLTVYNYYDTKGNLTRTVSRMGEVTWYDYNEYGEIIKADLPVSPDLNYFYNDLGLLIKVNQQNKFEKIYRYDERGRMTTETLIVDPGLSTQKSYTNTYTYNKINALTTIAYPSSAGTLSYSFNALNQIVVANWGSTSILKSASYTKTGHLSALTYGNDVVGSFNYNYVNGTYVPDNITYRQGTNYLGVYDYRYDKLGNIIRLNNHLYEYDDLGQLVGWRFFKENDQVLVGEEVIWDKQMTDESGLSLNQTTVSDNRLELAIQPNNAIIEVSKLLSAGSVKSSSSVETSHLGYSLYRDRQNQDINFSDASKLNSTMTTAYVNTAAGTATIPVNQSSDRWISVLNQQPNYQLPKTATNSVSTTINTITPNYNYAGFQYENASTWVPDPSSGNWRYFTNMILTPANMTDITKVNFRITNNLRNTWSVFGGWGNWVQWVKVVINGVYVGMVSFQVGTNVSEDQAKELPVNLVTYGLNNPASNLTVNFYYLINKCGAGATDGGTIKTINVIAKEKTGYHVGTWQYQQYPFSTPLYKDVTYKLNATETKPTGTYISYQLWDSTVKKLELTNDSEFKVTEDGTYFLRAYLKTDNGNVTPAVSTVTVSREKSYALSAVVQTATITLAQESKSIILDCLQTIPAGTSISYAVSNNNGATWVTPTWNFDMNKYDATFSTAGTQVVVKASMYTDGVFQRYTPIIDNIKVIGWDTGTYSTSGTVVTKNFTTTEPAKSIILELHAKENEGTIAPSLNINGTIINGVLTSSSDLVGGGKPGTGDEKNYSPGIGRTEDPLYEEARALRTEVAGKGLKTYYYKFNLPDNIAQTTFTSQITIKLYPSADRLRTPNVYSYILAYNKLQYYSTGSFRSEAVAVPIKQYSYDQVRLAVTGQSLPTGTTANYEVYLPGSTTPIPLTPGVNKNLGTEANTLTVKGNFTTTNQLHSPYVTGVTLTAIGETLFVNKLEATTDLTSIPTVTGTLTLSTDRVVGNSSIQVDHTSTGSVSYVINATQVFDATKLPIIQVWVKPLTNHKISFSTYDQVEGRDERIISDYDADGYFEVGQDLILNQWNLILLDLRKTEYGKIEKDAKGLKLVINTTGTKLLIDGVSMKLLNQATYFYDNAGNRVKYVENDLTTMYEYTMGSNRLERKYNSNENIYYTYDLNGNLARQEVTGNGSHYWFDYEFNELNQLMRVRKNNFLIVEYFYDHSGLRYKKVDYLTNKTTIYVYGQGTEPLYEEVYNNSNITTPTNKISYLNMGRQRLAKVDNGSIAYYFTDHLGSTRIVIDAAGNYTKFDYQPFGADFGGTSSERYKFTGKEDEELTGLFYLNARYYNPQIGRFISEDSGKDGLNWYIYCRNNPLSSVDPNGKSSIYFSKMGQYVSISTVTVYRYENRTFKMDENNEPVGQRSFNSFVRSKKLLWDTIPKGMEIVGGIVAAIGIVVSVPVEIVSGVGVAVVGGAMDQKSGFLDFVNTQIGSGTFVLEKVVYKHLLFEEVVDPINRSHILVLVNESISRRYYITWQEMEGPKREEINQQVYSAAIECSGGDPVVDF